MFIDIHVHLRRRPGFPREWDGQSYPSPQQLIEVYDRSRVSCAVIMPAASPECCHTPQSLENVLDICAEFPGRFVPFCNCDPRFLKNSPDAPLDGFLAYYKERGCKGVGEVTANLPFDDPMVENLFAACQKVGLPLTFHVGPQIGGCYGLVDEPGLPKLEAALGKFPDLVFLGHSQPFWAEIGPLPDPEARRGYPQGAVKEPGRVVELMREHPNLHGDLSANSGFNAVSRDEEFGARFLEEFQDRLYFGTDMTSPSGQQSRLELADYLERLRAEDKISAACFEKVAHGNAERLLGL
jgi:predicted TIM-barrel fold metal-dependent hydrolase